MNGQPFPANAKVVRIAVTAAGPSAAVQLPATANQVRIVNHGLDAYLAFAGSQAGAIAQVPSAVESLRACPSLGGSDIVMGIPNDNFQWVSAILDAGAVGTTFIDIMVGEGI